MLTKGKPWEQKVLTKKEVEYVARLAILALSEAEKEKMTVQLDSILQYVDLLVHVYRFQLELFAGLYLDACTATLRTDQFHTGGLVFLPAIETGESHRHAPEVQGGAFGNGAIADNVPIELDRIIQDGRPLPDYKIQGRDAAGIIFLCMADGNFKQAFGDG